MPERRLLILESYSTDNPNREQWRLMNAPGLPFSDDLRQYVFYEPVHCRPAVLDEITKVLSLFNSSYGVWRLIGVIIKGPKGAVLAMDGNRYRRAIIERVPVPPHICATCGQRCHQSDGNPANAPSIQPTQPQANTSHPTQGT